MKYNFWNICVNLYSFMAIIVNLLFKVKLMLNFYSWFVKSLFKVKLMLNFYFYIFLKLLFKVKLKLNFYSWFFKSLFWVKLMPNLNFYDFSLIPSMGRLRGHCWRGALGEKVLNFLLWCFFEKFCSSAILKKMVFKCWGKAFLKNISKKRCKTVCPEI